MYVTCMSVLQGEQEYEMRVKLYDEVDSEQSRWEILSTKVRSSHIHRALQVSHAQLPCICLAVLSSVSSPLREADGSGNWVPQIEIRLHKVNPSVSWPTLEASDTRPAANWSLPTEPPRVSTMPRVHVASSYENLQ
jgi:hypothetical protein